MFLKTTLQTVEKYLSRIEQLDSAEDYYQVAK